MGYQPIENYGVIGDLHTVALVGLNGSIDWFCLPHFDSPSVFGALIDHANGGSFEIAPATEGVKSDQYYLPETNVLVTRFMSPEGVAEVTDFMPVGGRDDPNTNHLLIRSVSGIRGAMHLRMRCTPAFDYGREHHETFIEQEGASFQSPSSRLGLWCTTPVRPDGEGVSAVFTVQEGEPAILFSVGDLERAEKHDGCCSPEWMHEQFDRTVEYWRRWISKSTYSGRWREVVHRSALVLKLLTFAPTGAIVAAPTAALPEQLGGVRNWDYRYTWIRDAAFTVYGLIRIGLTEEAGQFMKWLEARCAELEPDGSLNIMYGIDGRHELAEETLDHLEGYKGSSPVRIGNGAYGQLQLDIYGELMDAVYLYNKYGSPISYDFWNHLKELTDWVCKNWRRKDEGIWEVRGGKRHFVYSKVMCWVAVDRALRLADKRSFPADRARWLAVRDEIYEDIMENGWNHELQTFVQAYGSTCLDASSLIMPLVFFMSPTDPRMLSTLDAINRSPANGGLVSNSLVYRYNTEYAPDGIPGMEGTFNMCTFWLVEALTRSARVDRSRLDQARLVFERMLGYANHLGLYGEEIGPTGETLGNFPQAFTHLSLISAAFNLDRALGEGV